MRELHNDFIERWAKFMKENPDKWKKIHTEFIDAQFEKANNVIKELSKTKQGREKIIKVYNIKNINGYKDLLSS